MLYEGGYTKTQPAVDDGETDETEVKVTIQDELELTVTSLSSDVPGVQEQTLITELRDTLCENCDVCSIFKQASQERRLDELSEDEATYVCERSYSDSTAVATADDAQTATLAEGAEVKEAAVTALRATVTVVMGEKDTSSEVVTSMVTNSVAATLDIDEAALNVVASVAFPPALPPASSPSPPPPPSDSGQTKSDGGGVSAAVIGGAVAAGAVALLIAGVGVVICTRRQREKRRIEAARASSIYAEDKAGALPRGASWA